MQFRVIKSKTMSSWNNERATLVDMYHRGKSIKTKISLVLNSHQRDKADIRM